MSASRVSRAVATTLSRAASELSRLGGYAAPSWGDLASLVAVGAADVVEAMRDTHGWRRAGRHDPDFVRVSGSGSTVWRCPRCGVTVMVDGGTSLPPVRVLESDGVSPACDDELVKRVVGS